MTAVTMLNHMPAQPKAIGRQFVACYYNIMNKSPDNLHCLYTEDANFCHDTVDPAERETISVNGKLAIRDVMVDRMQTFRHTCTRVSTVDTYKTLEDGLIVQLLGEVSFNDGEFRAFSQTFLLVPKTPFKYFVQNDIFRFNESPQSTASQCSESMTFQSISVDDQCEGDDVENTSFDAVEDIDSSEYEMKAEVHKHYNETSAIEEPREEQDDSFDSDKSIMDIQSLNLKNALLEPRAITKETIMKRVPTPPLSEHGSNKPGKNENDSSFESESITENQNQLFRDKCILTIGNVINPNIDFDEECATEATAQEISEVENKVDEKELAMREKKKALQRKRKMERKRLSRIHKAEKPVDDGASSINENPLPAIPAAMLDSKKSWGSEVSDFSDDNRARDEQSELKKSTAKPHGQADASPPVVVEKPKTFADLVKRETPGQNDEWQSNDLRKKSFDQRGLDSSDNFVRSSKMRSSVPQRRGRQENRVSPKDSSSNTTHMRRSSSNGDLLQVFVGNIPHEADDNDICAMFSQFGRIRRFRMHSNPRVSRVPHYAFINFESIQSVRRCLAKRNSFYWPPHSKNAAKLNVNGDDSLMLEVGGSPPSGPESVTQKKNVKSIGTDTADLNDQVGRDLKHFHKNFHLADSKDSTQRRPSKSNINNVISTVKNERSATRNGSTRA